MQLPHCTYYLYTRTHNTYNEQFCTTSLSYSFFFKALLYSSQDAWQSYVTCIICRLTSFLAFLRDSAHKSLMYRSIVFSRFNIYWPSLAQTFEQKVHNKLFCTTFRPFAKIIFTTLLTSLQNSAMYDYCVLKIFSVLRSVLSIFVAISASVGRPVIPYWFNVYGNILTSYGIQWGNDSCRGTVSPDRY